MTLQLLTSISQGKVKPGNVITTSNSLQLLTNVLWNAEGKMIRTVQVVQLTVDFMGC